MGTHNDNAVFSSSRTDNTVLPLPPKNINENKFEMEIYARFMKHLRHVPSNRMDVKILSSVQFTADMMYLSDALVAKNLVDMGLRSRRKAFPISFLDFADKSVMRNSWDHGGGPAPSVMALKEYWDRIGENRFGNGLRTEYAVFNSNVYVAV